MSPEPAKPISLADFLAVDIRCGTVVKAQTFARARKPALKLWVDFGPEIEVRKSSLILAASSSPVRQGKM